MMTTSTKPLKSFEDRLDDVERRLAAIQRSLASLSARIDLLFHPSTVVEDTLNEYEFTKTYNIPLKTVRDAIDRKDGRLLALCNLYKTHRAVLELNKPWRVAYARLVTDREEAMRRFEGMDIPLGNGGMLQERWREEEGKVVGRYFS